MGEMVTIDKCPVCSEPGFLAKRQTYGRSNVKYWHYYVGHYDGDRYTTTKTTKNKRTNGRTWCYIPDNKLTDKEKEMLR
jgi:hypothetical protein